MTTYYRGGPSLAPRRIDVIINRKTGLVMPTRGVSVFDQPDGLDRFGGAYEVGPIPDALRLVKTGRNPHHYEIAPAFEMTFERYEFELAKISLQPV
jgi:hypothetical protein